MLAVCILGGFITWAAYAGRYDGAESIPVLSIISFGAAPMIDQLTICAACPIRRRWHVLAPLATSADRPGSLLCDTIDRPCR